MSSWPRKIYLLFWVALIGLTGLAAVVIPRLLDSAHEQGYREIDGQGRPPVTSRPLATARLDTSFPTRPFDATAEGSASPQPARQEEAPSRQPFPTEKDDRPDRAPRGPGLPQREVGSAPAQDGRGQGVTSRVRVVENSSVYESPRTTARVLGTVPPGTVVRWLKSAESGWEEIVLSDGRSVYMLSSTLALGGGGSAPPAGSRAESDSDIMERLPGTVDSFLSTLRDGDLTRASTYLSASAPLLEEPNLGAWGPMIGPESDARLDRMEPVSGRGQEWRSVLVLDQSNGARVQTVWSWDAEQQRWLLAEWD